MEEIDLKIDFRSKKPLSDQIRDQIRVLVDQGILLPNSQLPTVRSLAALLSINFNTVARAYRALDQEGLISTQLGRGTYVLAQKETHSKSSDEAQAEWLEQKIERILNEASRIGISPEQLRIALERRLQFTAKGKPSVHRIIRAVQKKRPRAALWDQDWPENETKRKRNPRKIRKIWLKRRGS